MIPFRRLQPNQQLLGLVSFFLFLSASAHTMVLSQYSLKRENKQWILQVEQKTRHIRDAIYATHPELKGINLNGELFRKATADHIASSIVLKFRGKILEISPLEMHYGGLRFESTFMISGLPKNPDYLTIITGGYDAHEHSVMLFRVLIENEGFLHHFNQWKNLATFDFATHHFSFEVINPKRTNIQVVLYLLLFLGLFVAVALLLKRSGLRFNFLYL